MSEIKCEIKEFKKVESVFHELVVKVIGQEMQYFILEFRGKTYLIEEKKSRVSQRVKNAIFYYFSNYTYNEVIEILSKEECIYLSL